MDLVGGDSNVPARRENEMQRVIEIMEDFCKEYDFDFRDDYSGRGMYGRKCVGFVVGADVDLLLTLVELTEMLIDNGIEYVSSKLEVIRYDSMGTGTIIYFPKLVKANREE